MVWRVSSDGGAPDCRSGGRGFESRTRRSATELRQPKITTVALPGWCTGQHGGVRSPSSQFDSGPGCHLAVAQRIKSTALRRQESSVRIGPARLRGPAVPAPEGSVHGDKWFRKPSARETLGVRFFNLPPTPATCHLPPSTPPSDSGQSAGLSIRKSGVSTPWRYALRGSSAVERPVVARRRRGFEPSPRSHLGAEVLKDARVASTHEEPGRYRPALPSRQQVHLRFHPGPRTAGPRLRASWDGSALIRRDDRVRFPGGLRNQEWRSGSAALSHREGRQFESDLLDRSGGLVRMSG